MHRPLFLVTAGSIAAAGGLIFASALPAAAATAGPRRRTPVPLLAPRRPAQQPDPGDVRGHDSGSARHHRAGRPLSTSVPARSIRPSAPPPTSALSRLPTTAPLTLLVDRVGVLNRLRKLSDLGRHHPRRRCNLYRPRRRQRYPWCHRGQWGTASAHIDGHRRPAHGPRRLGHSVA